MTRLTWFYDREGRPLDVRSWAALVNDFAYSQLEADFVRQVFVSTRWIGVDRRMSQAEGVPLIFETLISDGGAHVETHLYPSEPAARAGHRRSVNGLRRQYRRRMMLQTIAGTAMSVLLWHLVHGWWL